MLSKPENEPRFDFCGEEESGDHSHKFESNMPMVFGSDSGERPAILKYTSHLPSPPFLSLPVSPPRMLPIKLEEPDAVIGVYPDASYLHRPASLHSSSATTMKVPLTAPTTEDSSNNNKVFTVQSLPNPVLEVLQPVQPENLPEEMQQAEDHSPDSKESPSYISGEGSSDKKSKQERNRESARKCRQRKKEYVSKLEAELKAAKEELAVCKNELAALKAKVSIAAEKGFTELRDQLASQIKKSLEVVKPMPQLAEILYYFNVSLLCGFGFVNELSRKTFHRISVE